MQNLAQFWSTSNFNDNYLWNGVGQVHHQLQFLPRLAQKSGELWSTNDENVDSYPPKSTFSQDQTSAPKWCCAPKYSHVLENDQVMPVCPHQKWRSSLQFFSKGCQKLA